MTVRKKKMIHVLVQAGNGGKGCESLLKRKDKKVLPNGGDGGHGGDVIFKASHNAAHIERLKLRQHILAEHGTQGGSDRKRGKRGKHVVILVPPGTRVFNRETGMSLRDLAKDGDEVIVARGGAGGIGNDGGKKNTPGQIGEKLEIDLEHLIVADVFLLGFPNSGKSSFLKKTTHSSVLVEEYSFATKRPSIGTYDYDEYKQLVFCELPSIYDGSLDDHGLGFDFLKNLKRAHFICYFLDANSYFKPTLLEQWNDIQLVCEESNVDITSKSTCVIVNKIDLVDSDSLKEQLKSLKSKIDLKIFALSLETGEGIEPLMKELEQKVESIKAEHEAFE